MNSYELHESNAHIYTVPFLNSKCVNNRRDSTPHWLVTLHFTRTTSLIFCSPNLAVAVLGPRCIENKTDGNICVCVCVCVYKTLRQYACYLQLHKGLKPPCKAHLAAFESLESRITHVEVYRNAKMT